MNKRIIAMAMTCALSAATVTSAFASYSSAGATESKLNASERMAAAGTIMASSSTMQADDIDAASGVTFNRVSQLTDSQKANLNTALQEILKKVPETRIKKMYTGDIDATGSGKVTFKGLGSYSGAIVMHQASNGVWDNTAEECKNGEVEHTFNGFSPVAILMSDMTKNQLKATDFASSVGNAGSSNGSGSSSGSSSSSSSSSSSASSAAKNAVASSKALASGSVSTSGITVSSFTEGLKNQAAINSLPNMVQTILNANTNMKILDVFTCEIEGTGTGTLSFNVGATYANKFAFVGHFHNNQWTYQQVKVDANGIATATVNSLSPFAVVVTDQTAKVNIADTEFGNNAAAAGVNGASPKTGEAGTLYVLLAMAAVAGTAVVATKKSR